MIERRRGLPIALSVLYIEVGRRAGVELDGVGFPGHFLICTRKAEGEPRFYVDPFHAGKVLTRADLLARLTEMQAPSDRADAMLGPAPASQILLRMSYNLKGSYLALRDLPAAIRQIDRILAIAPGQLEEHRDRGLLLAEGGRGDDALASLRRYLELAPDADDRDIITEVIAQLES